MGFLNFLSTKNKLKEKKDCLLEELNFFINKVKNSKCLIPQPTHLLLQAGEDAFLETTTTLLETKSVRYNQRAGAGFRIAKGVYIGGARGRSESKEEWRVIDKGTLTLTDKRLIFDGDQEDKIIPLKKIIAVKPSLDSIEISADGKKKSSLFTVGNSFIWTTVIRLLIKNKGNPNQIDDVKVNISFQ